jgi:hypothetical protein
MINQFISYHNMKNSIQSNFNKDVFSLTHNYSFMLPYRGFIFHFVCKKIISKTLQEIVTLGSKYIGKDIEYICNSFKFVEFLPNMLMLNH